MGQLKDSNHQYLCLRPYNWTEGKFFSCRHLTIGKETKHIFDPEKTLFIYCRYDKTIFFFCY